MILQMRHVVTFLILMLGIVFMFASSAFAEETAKVLIQFDGPIQANDRAFIHGLGGEISHEYTLVSAVAVEIPENALNGLSHNPRITTIEEDLEVQAMLFDDEYRDTWSISNINAKPVHDNGNVGGTASIGIIDSGISNTHPDLNVAGEYDFVNKTPTSDDVYGHGTHVAGTACATMDGTGAVGVAPACDLYDLRVLNDAGSGNTSDILAAVDWATGNNPGNIKLDVINLSLGRSTDMGSVAEATFQAAYDAGVLVVAAAGNSGNRNGRGTNTIYPANYSSVIAVAATDSNDNRARFSSTGANVEIAAPGAGVHSTWNDIDSYSNPQPVCDVYGCYKDASGTSMASPQVAGVAALVISAGVQNNQEVRSILQETASDLGNPSHYGSGLVNAQAAVASAIPSDDPVAFAGPDQNIEVAEGVASADVSLDGSGSYDQTDGGVIVSYQWLLNAVEIASGTNAVVTLPIGEHAITLKVTDNEGLTDEDTVVIAVTEYVAPEPSTKFSINNRVKTQGVLNVRDDANGELLGQQPRNTEGTVKGGPVYAVGYWWWYIDYDASSIGDVDGWSVEKWLRKLK